MADSCCAILIAPIWPIVSMTFGLIAGTISGVIGTLIVFMIGLIHLPFQLWNTLSVAATTDECFKGMRGNLWRVPILLLSPIGPISFLVASTLVSATFGTLVQIGFATGVVYDHEYAEAAEKTRENLRFEEDSHLGGFLKMCRKVIHEDEYAMGTVKILKWLYTFVFSFAFACVAVLPFAVAMAAVTVFRLPINFFKTMKIALFTVMIRWDLRIIVLLMLPLIHTLFPVVVLVVSMIGSFFWTWAQTQQNLYKDRHPFQEWGLLIDTVKDYYDEHKKFVSKRCDRFDHPTGIPMGWNGRQYGLEIERMIRFQLKFLLCVALMLYQTPIILTGTAAIVLIKYIPACLHFWRGYVEECICDSESNCVVVLSLWPFHVLAIALIPVGNVLLAFVFILIALLVGYWDVLYLTFDDAGICACLSIPFANIRRCDKYTSKYYYPNENFRLVTKQCFSWSVIGDAEEEESGQQHSSSARREILNADVYWDRFATQCIQSTTELLLNGFLDYDSVEGMDPSCVQSIPSVAVFTILMDSLQKEGLKRGDVYWKLDETVCEAKGRAQLDNIGAFLWPMIVDLQTFMKKNKKALLKQEDQQIMMAMQALLCDNHESDESTDEIRKVLDMTSEKQKALMNQLRTKISRLVLAILRVRPFQERMEKIFEHEYENPKKTMNYLEAQPLGDEAQGDTRRKEAEADPNSEETASETIRGIFGKYFGNEETPNNEETFTQKIKGVYEKAFPSRPQDDGVVEDTRIEEVEGDTNNEETAPQETRSTAVNDEADAGPKHENSLNEYD